MISLHDFTAKGAAPLLLCDATPLAGCCPSAGGPAETAQKFAEHAVQDEVPVSARHTRQPLPVAERDRGPAVHASETQPHAVFQSLSLSQYSS